MKLLTAVTKRHYCWPPGKTVVTPPGVEVTPVVDGDKIKGFGSYAMFKLPCGHNGLYHVSELRRVED